MNQRQKRNIAIGGAALAAGLLLLFASKSSADQDVPEPEPDDDDRPRTGSAVPSKPTGRPGGPTGTKPPETPTGKPNLDELESEDPRSGRMYQVRRRDIFLGKDPDHSIVWQVLFDAAYLAATDVGGLPVDEAEQFAKVFADSSRNRGVYFDAIVCEGWNDLNYGTWGYGSKARPGPHGRSIRLLPIHVDNRDRLRQGLPTIRNIQLRTPADAKTGNGKAIDRTLSEGYEYLYLPDINLDLLWQDGRITSEGLEWPDGSSRVWPHPSVMRLGIVEDPGLAAYGCGEAVLEVS